MTTPTDTLPSPAALRAAYRAAELHNGRLEDLTRKRFLPLVDELERLQKDIDYFVERDNRIRFEND